MQANKKSAPGLFERVMVFKKGYDGNGKRGPRPNRHAPIQYGLIMKILDMVFYWNNRR